MRHRVRSSARTHGIRYAGAVPRGSRAVDAPGAQVHVVQRILLPRARLATGGGAPGWAPGRRGERSPSASRTPPWPRPDPSGSPCTPPSGSWWAPLLHVKRSRDAAVA